MVKSASAATNHPHQPWTSPSNVGRVRERIMAEGQTNGPGAHVNADVYAGTSRFEIELEVSVFRHCYVTDR